MKTVFSLRRELESDPERVSLTQALTLDPSRPLIGLRGRNGLFASPEWWESISNGVMPLLRVKGRIVAAYAVSQDDDSLNDTIDVLGEDQEISSVGIYVNEEADIELFKPGAWIEMVYALDELKSQPAADGGVNYSRVALEVAISNGPAD